MRRPNAQRSFPALGFCVNVSAVEGSVCTAQQRSVQVLEALIVVHLPIPIDEIWTSWMRASLAASHPW
ncbi:hypothetical protein Cob_v004675 [Colletotrichum orbiculare MAFF 240422]|uniref:Uncharacterized protein n=1 Tax=Colletotrichum orbiculare (strain 104-T / ATCC 96160 / CBS 514.97 / LARS 414 / MAFF 240422) TaxID=1213857 RepID=A0A484FVH2_COLOR|nr:hypothetical protein Cob_v004675 [Colletotrichum orbiculare MAFF 240422]